MHMTRMTVISLRMSLTLISEFEATEHTKITHISTHTYTHTHTHTHTHSCTHTPTHPHTYSQHTCTHTRTQHTYTCIYTHTNTHTHTHTRHTNRGICDLPHLSLTGHHPTQRDAIVLPAMRDLWVTLLCAEHQVWLPGHHQGIPCTDETNELGRQCA